MASHHETHRSLLKVAMKYHPRIYSLIKRNGIHRLERRANEELFRFLARTATAQQLSAMAARSIWKKIEQLSQTLSVGIRDLCSGEYSAELRKCGLSNNKIHALTLLSESFETGKISEEQVNRCDYEKLSEIVGGLWGFGSWSANMVAMFFVCLPDVWPENDVALNRGMKLLVSNESPSKAAKKYTPYRTFLARHIWRGLDTGIILD